MSVHSPLARGQGLQDPTITGLAERLGRTPAQVMLRWAIQHQAIVIPKSTHKGTISANGWCIVYFYCMQQQVTVPPLAHGTRFARRGHSVSPQLDPPGRPRERSMASEYVPAPSGTTRASVATKPWPANGCRPAARRTGQAQAATLRGEPVTDPPASRNGKWIAVEAVCSRPAEEVHPAVRSRDRLSRCRLQTPTRPPTGSGPPPGFTDPFGNRRWTWATRRLASSSDRAAARSAFTTCWDPPRGGSQKPRTMAHRRRASKSHARATTQLDHCALPHGPGRRVTEPANPARASVRSAAGADTPTGTAGTSRQRRSLAHRQPHVLAAADTGPCFRMLTDHPAERHPCPSAGCTRHGCHSAGVISQHPEARTSVGGGEDVRLTVSKGTPFAEVPAVPVGVSAPAAERTLARAGFRARLRYTPSWTVRKGAVIELRPGAGVRLRRPGDGAASSSLLATPARSCRRSLNVGPRRGSVPSWTPSICATRSSTGSMPNGSVNQVVGQIPSAGAVVYSGSRIRADGRANAPLGEPLPLVGNRPLPQRSIYRSGSLADPLPARRRSVAACACPVLLAAGRRPVRRPRLRRDRRRPPAATSCRMAPARTRWPWTHSRGWTWSVELDAFENDAGEPRPGG